MTDLAPAVGAVWTYGSPARFLRAELLRPAGPWDEALLMLVRDERQFAAILEIDSQRSFWSLASPCCGQGYSETCLPFGQRACRHCGDLWDTSFASSAYCVAERAGIPVFYPATEEVFRAWVEERLGVLQAHLWASETHQRFQAFSRDLNKHCEGLQVPQGGRA